MTLKKKIENHFILQSFLAFMLGVFFFTVRKIKKKRSASFNKVAIIAIHKLGDTIFTIPAIRTLMFYYNYDLTIVCSKDSEKIYKTLLLDLNYFIVEESDYLFNKRIASPSIKKKFKKECFDIIIDLKGSVISASLIYDYKCYKIFGINEIYFKKIYECYSPIRKSPHQIDIYFDAIRTFNPKLQANFLNYGKKYNKDGKILIHPFAGWKAKEWSFKRFLELYSNLSKKYKCAIVVPRNKIQADISLELAGQHVIIIQTENLESLIDEISNCRMFISNDSGPIQIAALLGKPTLTIYGPTNPKFHMPFGDHHRYINKILKCSPIDEKYCYADGGDSCPHHDCLNLLTVEKVLAETEELIAAIENE